MYNPFKYSKNYSKASGRLWQYYKDELNATLTESESFKLKARITVITPDDGNIKDAKMAVPLKYFSNFWRTLEVALINCEIK